MDMAIFASMVITAHIICEVLRIEDGAIVFWDVFVAGHEHMAASTAACVCLRKIGGIVVDCECHVACRIGENCIVLRCHVIKKLLAKCHGPFRWFGLLGCERAECREKAAVDTVSKEKEYAANLLDKLLSCRVKGGESSSGLAYCSLAS